MVCITSELWYNGEKVGYRCCIGEPKTRRVKYVDIDTEEYAYVVKKYGSLAYVSGKTLGKIVREPLSLNQEGYLCTGTEPRTYSDEGLSAVESDITKTISTDLDCINKNKAICWELKRKFKEYNEKYFDNKIPNSLRILVSSRYRTCAGKFTFYRREPYRNTITMSSMYMSKFPEETDDTLIHEMIHAYLYELGYYKENHGSLFKSEMRRLNSYGFNVTIYAENRCSNKKYKFALQCKGCGLISKGARKLRYDLKYYQCSLCKSAFEYVHQEDFYEAYECNNCNEIFFEDDESALGLKQYCPYCSSELHTI